MVGTYDAQTATARRLIRAKGRATQIAATLVTPRDPVSQTGGSASVTTHTVDAVGLPPGKSAEYVLGSLARRNISDFYIAHDRDFTPEPGNTITWGGHDWTLIWTATYDPAADGAIFTQAYGERGGG